VPKSSLLDPLIIAQLGNLKLRARRILDGLYSGHHNNPVRGSSQEFSQHRAYNPGDDLKTVDWKAFGRSDRLIVKQYEEETNVATTVVLDSSASMKFSHDGRISKLEYAKTMAAALGYLLVAQQDGVGLVSPSETLPVKSGRAHLEEYVAALERVNGGGVWNPTQINSARGMPRRKSLVVVFSDLMANEEETVASVRALHAHKHDVIVFQVLDPAELDLPFEGPFLFEDLETGEKLKTDADALRAAYRMRVKEKLAGFATVFRGAGIDYSLLTTDMPFNKGMGSFLTWRAAY
jgi:uncharacterized protein (DUF58 family)